MPRAQEVIWLGIQVCGEECLAFLSIVRAYRDPAVPNTKLCGKRCSSKGMTPMDDLEDMQLRKLEAAYRRVRVCGDLRGRVKAMTLEEIERLEKEPLAAYERRKKVFDT